MKIYCCGTRVEELTRREHLTCFRCSKCKRTFDRDVYILQHTMPAGDWGWNDMRGPFGMWEPEGNSGSESTAGSR